MGQWTIKLGIQTSGRNKSFQSLIFVLTPLYLGQWNSFPYCLPSLHVQWPAKIFHSQPLPREYEVRECIPTNGSVPDQIIWNVFWEQAVIFRNGCYWFVHDTWCVRCGSVSAYVWINGICHFCRWIGKFSTGSRDRFLFILAINSSRSFVRRLADAVHANCLLVNCEFALPAGEALPKILGGGRTVLKTLPVFQTKYMIFQTLFQTTWSGL